MATPSREEMSDILSEPIRNPSGCWKDYNNDYKRWTTLNRLLRVGTQKRLIQPAEIPDKPEIDDYSDLDSSCE